MAVRTVQKKPEGGRGYGASGGFSSSGGYSRSGPSPSQVEGARKAVVGQEGMGPGTAADPIPDQLGPGGAGQRYLTGGESTAPGSPSILHFIKESVLGIHTPKPGMPTIIEATTPNPLQAGLQAVLRAAAKSGPKMSIPDDVMRAATRDMAERMARSRESGAILPEPSFRQKPGGEGEYQLNELYPQRAASAVSDIDDAVNDMFFYSRSPVKKEYFELQREGNYAIGRPNPNEAAKEIGLSPTGMPATDIRNLSRLLGRQPTDQKLQLYLDMYRRESFTIGREEADDAVSALVDDTLESLTRRYSPDEVSVADDLMAKDLPSLTYEDALEEARDMLARRATYREELTAQDLMRDNPSLSREEALRAAKTELFEPASAGSYKSPGVAPRYLRGAESSLPLGGRETARRIAKEKRDAARRKREYDARTKPEARYGEEFQEFLRDKWRSVYNQNLLQVRAAREAAQREMLGLEPSPGIAARKAEQVAALESPVLRAKLQAVRDATAPSPEDAKLARSMTDEMWPGIRADAMQTRAELEAAKKGVTKPPKSAAGDDLAAGVRESLDDQAATLKLRIEEVDQELAGLRSSSQKARDLRKKKESLQEAQRAIQMSREDIAPPVGGSAAARETLRASRQQEQAMRDTLRDLEKERKAIIDAQLAGRRPPKGARTEAQVSRDIDRVRREYDKFVEETYRADVLPEQIMGQGAVRRPTEQQAVNRISAAQDLIGERDRLARMAENARRLERLKDEEKWVYKGKEAYYEEIPVDRPGIVTPNASRPVYITKWRKVQESE